MAMTKICYNVNARNYGSISQIWADSAKWDFVDYKDESRRVETRSMGIHQRSRAGIKGAGSWITRVELKRKLIKSLLILHRKTGNYNTPPQRAASPSDSIWRACVTRGKALVSKSAILRSVEIWGMVMSWAETWSRIK